MSKTIPESLSAAKLALEIKQIRASIPEIKLLRSEPIAIVGIGCRFPGGARSADDYWNLLRDGVDAISEIPSDRWDASALYDADPAAPGKMNTRWGGFLADVDRFDPSFFGIAPREAASMDPQQRLLLEVSWEALWDSGTAPDGLAGSNTGVFVSIYNTDYARLLLSDRAIIGPHACAGTAHSIASGRISFLLDLRGPSISVDTACSSSLVAVHLACESLRAGDCSMALAGGVSLTLTPEHYLSLSKLSMLSPDGRCRTFDERANGFVPGEGCGVVVLKRLSDSLAQGDHVYAVIRGTALNQDGRTNVLTAPNGLAQRAVLRAALRNAQVDPSMIAYVETHGTGTALGDPIEVEALTEVLGAKSGDRGPCFLGAVKTNFGHLEAAAGIAGLIKTALVLEREEIPPNLHYQSLNPHISLESTRLCIPTSRTPWPRGAKGRFAGVSSFGFSGTNAHMVLEEAPRLPARAPSAALSAPQYVLPISARTPEALRDFAGLYRSLLSRDDLAAGPYEICRTAALRRSHYEERLALAASSRSEFVQLLDSFLEGKKRHGVARGRASSEAESVVFVCSGQGSQWPRMGARLLGQESVFRLAMEECDELIRRFAGWSMLEKISAADGNSQLGHTEYAQPAIFGIEVALARLWQSWGVVPAAVIGHSAGEVAAAHIAGILSLEEASRIVAHRGRLMAAARGKGKMAVVRLPSGTVAKELTGYETNVSIAAINSSQSTVISGESSPVNALLAEWQDRGIACRELSADYAFHNAQMQPFSEQLVRILQAVTTRRQTIPIISTVLGRTCDGAELDAAYWGHNIRRTVLFAAAVDTAVSMGLRTFLEIGPHPVLLNAVGECLENRAGQAHLIPSLRRGQDDREAMLSSLGSLYAVGCPVAWEAVYPAAVPRVTLPNYPYQRQRYWGYRRAIEAPNTLHPLVGARVRSPSLRGLVFESRIGTRSLPYLTDHQIEGQVLLPMSAYLEMAHRAVSEVIPGPQALSDVVVLDPVVFRADQPVTLQVIIEDRKFRVVSAAGEDWKEHASGRIAAIAEPDHSRVLPNEREVTATESHYENLRRHGAEFGPAFQTVAGAFGGSGEAWACVRLQENEKREAAQYRMHPALLDGCLQAAMIAAPAELEGVYLPFGVDHFEPYAPAGDMVWAHAKLLPASDGRLSADLEIRGVEGSLVARLRGVHLKRRQHMETGSKRRVYEVNWRKSERGGAIPANEGAWVVLTDHSADGAALAGALEARGETVLVGELGRSEFPAERLQAVVAVIHGTPPGDRKPASGDGCRAVLALVQDLLQRFPEQPPRLWLITQGAAAVLPTDRVPGLFESPVHGLARTIAVECPELRCARIDVDPSDLNFAALAEELTLWDGEEEIAFREDERYVPRLAPKRLVAGPFRRLTIPARGSIDNLAIETFERLEPGSGEVEVRVEATGLNFRDVLNVLGMYPGDPGQPGVEFCGRVVRAGMGVTGLAPGDRVMGLAWGSFASFVVTPAALVVRVPALLGSVDAATVPNAFLTAYHCLIHLGNLRSGERVLIHAAAGGVGLAAVQVAQHAGAEIFATAGSQRKREYLRSLGVQHVFSSRNLDFAREIPELTQGKGVDLVLNSLTGEFIGASFSTMAPNGRFLEIGKKDIWSQERVQALSRPVVYFVVDLEEVITTNPALIQSHLIQVASGIEDGTLHPLPATVFGFESAASAFRYMAQARHTGKIVVQHPAGIRAQGNRTYLVAGGLGAIGLKISSWLVGQGARHLVLLGRHAPQGNAAATVEALRRTGAQVQTYSADVSQPDELKIVLNEIQRTMPPLGGVVHAAGILDDGVLREQTWSRFARVMAPKVAGAWNLHELTAGLPLDFFLLCSSLASITGSPGQGGYAAANAFLDALAHYRQARGLPALSVNWGAWAEVGMAARVETHGRRPTLRGLRPMPVSECLASMEVAADTSSPQITVSDVDWTQWTSPPRLLSELVRRTAGKAESKRDEILGRLETAPPGNRRSILVAYLREQALRVLGLTGHVFIDERQPLIRMGLDSLMAVEFRNQLVAALQRPLTATLLFDQPTIGALADFLLASTGPSAPSPMRDPLLAGLDTLSEEEAEELLKEELERS